MVRATRTAVKKMVAGYVLRYVYASRVSDCKAATTIRYDCCEKFGLCGEKEFDRLAKHNPFIECDRVKVKSQVGRVSKVYLRDVNDLGTIVYWLDDGGSFSADEIELAK